jgi:hypothetical protein
MNVQEIFNKVIEAGLYNEKDGLMCHSLKVAARQGTITAEEFIAAKGDIQSYLKGFGSLGGFLDYKGRPYSFEARFAVYKDWANKI